MVLVSLCELAQIAELNAEEMYTRKPESLQQLHAAAERTHVQLLRLSKQIGIGSSDMNSSSNLNNEIAALHLHNRKVHCPPSAEERCANASPVYYHTVLLTFRPFLILEASATSVGQTVAMWLRQACRHATDAAQDSLVFVSMLYAKSEVCRVYHPSRP